MIQSIKNDIKKLIVNLQKKNLILNPKFPDKICSENAISTGTTMIKFSEDYEEKRLREYDEDRYIFLFDDGSFFQMSYTCTRDSIVSANLSFWPGDYAHMEYIRYDFIQREEDNFYHASSHLHIGLKESVRLPVDKILYPSDFVLLIMYLYYNDYFEKLKSFYNIKTDKNHLSENYTMYKTTKEFMHIKIKNS